MAVHEFKEPQIYEYTNLKASWLANILVRNYLISVNLLVNVVGPSPNPFCLDIDTSNLEVTNNNRDNHC